jgi:hypothetical protein
MADDEIRVLGDDTPVARRQRRIGRLPRRADAIDPLWNEHARARPVALALSPLNRPSGRAAAQD